MATTILDIPEEVLNLIFDYLETYEITRCRETCWSLYTPAHIRLLKHVHLGTMSSIQQFIASLNCNANLSYLNAVQIINIETKDNTCELERPMIEQLFCRFRNLSHIEIKGSPALFGHFNDQVCLDILDSCPKLGSVYVRTHPQHGDFSAFINVRLLVTTLDGRDVSSVIDNVGVGGMNVLDFLSRFPRLRAISGPCDYVQNFATWLEILQLLSNVSSIRLSDTDDEHELLEAYLLSMEDGKRKRLSKINQLGVWRTLSFCPVAMTFAAHHLTNMDFFELTADDNKTWTSKHTEVFVSHVLDLACSVKNDSFIDLNLIKFRDLADCLPDTIKKVFCQAPENAQKTLEITTKCKIRSYGFLSVEINKQFLEHKVRIEVSYEMALYQVMSSLLPLSGIDNFTFQFFRMNHGLVDPYAGRLKTFVGKNFESSPSSKPVVLDIPPPCRETPHDDKSIVVVLDKLKTLTLRTNCFTSLHDLMNQYAFTFPNLDCLVLDYENCFWNHEPDEILVSLTKYSLKTLTFDMTSALEKLALHLKNPVVPMEKLCYVFDVEIQESYQQHLFWLTPNLTGPTEIESTAQLEHLTHVNKCLVVRIFIHSLKRLKLVSKKKLCPPDSLFDDYLCAHILF